MLLPGLSASFQSFPPLSTSKLGPYGADSWVHWFVYVLGSLWVSPMNTPMKLGVPPCSCNLHRFLQPEVLRLSFPVLEPWVVQSVSLPSCSSWFICTQMWDCPLCQPPPCYVSTLPQLPISTPPTSMNECFFFNSLVVGLPYSSIFWQFWLFFCF